MTGDADQNAACRATTLAARQEHRSVLSFNATVNVAVASQIIGVYLSLHACTVMLMYVDTETDQLARQCCVGRIDVGMHV